MQIKLPKIAEIQYGTYAKTLDKGEVKYLHASHFDEFEKLTQFENSYIEPELKDLKFLLKENDVILAAKGSRNFAWVYTEEYGPCIPSSAFFIIRTNPSKVNGEYLAYYLNTERIQFLIKGMVTGSGMPSISKKEFMELEITLPKLNEQLKIVEVAKLMDEEIQLTSQLLSAKKNLKKGLIEKLITNQIMIPDKKRKSLE